MTTQIAPSISDDELSEITAFTEGPDPDGREVRGLTARELRGLIARLRAAEKDAARYRWLRDEDRLEMFGQLIVGESEGEDCYFGEQLDSVIDLHMEQQP